MKRMVCAALTLVMLVSMSGCILKTEVREGENNTRLHGYWVLINETPDEERVMRYWEFGDGEGYMVDYVTTVETGFMNVQLYTDAPEDDQMMEYVLSEPCEIVKLYDYSFTDDYGLEFQYENNGEYRIAEYLTEKRDWYFAFDNENEFMLTSGETTYHAYRLKEPLLTDEQREAAV